MASIYEYYMWQDYNNNNTIKIDDLDNYDILDIQLHFHHFLELTYPESNRIPLTTTHKSFPLPRTLIFSSDDQSRSHIINNILSTTGASTDFINSILTEVSSFASEIVSHPSNDNVKILTMGLFICVATPYDDREEIDRFLRETIQENARFEPASKSCIQRLNKIRVEDDGFCQKCVICLAKEEGEEIIKLGCGHVFHGDCIIKWLETSHLCPLCRFVVS
ncbi:E3 ubiquitin-protein ligase SGR9, amyloplastic-like [Mercurialis annua]|uniref:E3 ubiquitin-protein ligase SGR9, amyloplastic-like n=1 Tax=Mercurialis annua TaxID=3986 RepID=UPI00216075C9|nr:E3 ubiquitin-protein ligase SGR9, amyloplastic-like [Mercurialis annua]